MEWIWNETINISMPQQLTLALDQVAQSIGIYVPNLIGALLVLVVGWLVALIIAAIVRGILRGTKLDERIASWIVGKEGAKTLDVEGLVSKGVFYLVVLFVLVAFFETLGLTVVAEPLNQLLLQIFEYMPRLFGAGLLLFVAWVIASISKLVILRVLSTAKIDKRLEEKAGIHEEKKAPLTNTLGDAVYWVVFLLFLPAILDALAVEGLLGPVQSMVSQVLGFLPNIFAAALLLLVGWVAARIVQRIVTNVLAAFGVDRLSEKAGISQVLGTQRLSDVLGLVVYILILIPVLIAALNALALEAITNPASNMLDTILGAFPAIFAAGLVLVLAYMVGRVVTGLITNLLVNIGFNNMLSKIGLGKKAVAGSQTPADVVGYLVLVAIMLFALIEAFGLLGFELLAVLTAEFVVFAGHVIFGLVVFAIGLYLANVAAKTVEVSKVQQAGALASLARISILLLAGAMALRQMGLANEIVTLAFGLILGSVAVAIALALGLGGRDVAERHLEGWIKSLKK